MFTLAHSSDWHATDPSGSGLSPLLGKRFFGWLSWKIRRRRLHRPEVLEALRRDLVEQRPDHLAVTGDLTHIALPQEFRQAATQLEAFGTAEQVSLIPGNHDAYVAVPPDEAWDHWADYLRSDASTSPTAPTADAFPTLRVRGELALVGLCSAHPTPWFQASGRLGAEQLERLGRLLMELRERDCFRVVMVHHPPLDPELSARRELLDAADLRAVLAESGAELVLHGHRHHTRFEAVAGPDALIPVVGTRSASDVGERDEKRAQYHLFEIENRAEAGPDRPRAVRLRVRGFDPASGEFRAEGERTL